MRAADGGLFLTAPQILAQRFSLKFLVTKKSIKNPYCSFLELREEL